MVQWIGSREYISRETGTVEYIDGNSCARIELQEEYKLHLTGSIMK